MDIHFGILRQINTPLSAIGEWHLEKKVIPNLYSLEDTDRGLRDSMTVAEVAKIKVYGKTAVGVTDVKPYEIIVDHSNRFTEKFGRDMPMLHILDPKGFDGIRIHPANDASELLGCCAPGEMKDKNRIGASRIAYARILNMVKEVLGFSIVMAGTMPIIVPHKDFKAESKVYLDIARNYKL